MFDGGLCHGAALTRRRQHRDRHIAAQPGVSRAIHLTDAPAPMAGSGARAQNTPGMAPTPGDRLGSYIIGAHG
jgi:hypothetical protein